MYQSNSKDSGSLFLLPNSRGITLVELLVAMAILSIILTGLVAVFVSAIETTHQGYMIKEGYNNARVAMELLTKDLERACTLTDQGEKIQIYGTPTSLTFLTILDNGEIGRVTYFFAPSPNIPPFETRFPMKFEDDPSKNRIEKERWMKRLINNLPVSNLDTEMGGNPEFLQNSLPANCVEMARNLLSNVENLPALYPEILEPNPEPGGGMDYYVKVQPLALFRVEERGVKNLKDMPLKVGNSTGSMDISLPELRPDVVDNPLSGQGDMINKLMNAYLAEGLGSRVSISLVSPLELQNPEAELKGDFRNFVDDPNYQVIKEDFVNALLDIRKIQMRLYLMQIYDARRYCEEWKYMIQNPANVVALTSGDGILNLSTYIWSYDLSIPREDQSLLYQMFSFGGRDHLLTDPMSVGMFNYWESLGINPADYILVDGFGAHAFWIDEVSGILTSTDILYPGAMFSYQSEENETSMYFNDIRGVPLMNHYLSQNFAQLSLEEVNCLTAYLDRLWARMIGTDPSKNAPFGSFFFDRLPVRITVRAWVVIEKPQPGISDFVRWFSQSIDLPCGLRTPQPRQLPAGM
ncbi:MAG: prepilin-type N-terminal cleavage/methylation domain-containing protein [Candidatus Hydrogenedentes bacterium]|nr:prepilin-type N-terminal cleavage/methylation domain-containing protein [Candidatus Hydrogenedentota bacterium]